MSFETETPVCQVERVRLDLSDVRARRDLFSELGRRTNRALVVSEGLLVYLDEKEVTSLGQDLAVARKLSALGHRFSFARALENVGEKDGRASRPGRRAFEVRASRRPGLLCPQRMETGGDS